MSIYRETDVIRYREPQPFWSESKGISLKLKALIAAVGIGVSAFVASKLLDNVNGLECSDENVPTVVRQGDTIWEIAAEANESRMGNSVPTGELVYVIGDRNPQLQPGSLAVGSVVEVPLNCDL